MNQRRLGLWLMAAGFTLMALGIDGILGHTHLGGWIGGGLSMLSCICVYHAIEDR